MSEYDSLRTDLTHAIEAMGRMTEAAGATLNLVINVRDRHDQELAEIRDDIVALGNRIEALTNFVVTDPAEVASRMVDRG
jgi:hypothetical protein